MKKVLIIGYNSYIGRSFERDMKDRFDIDTVDARNDEWKKITYSGFDSVLYVAGIAHRRQSNENKDLYFAVNRDLAVLTAQKAKEEGVGQFIYFSSIYACGIKSGEITGREAFEPAANDHYGLSKIQAERLLETMQSENFYVAIIRPPMVYGPNCKGNFPQLVKIAKLLPCIPTLQNRRSMIFIENLTELLAIVIEHNVTGILCPQNREYLCTSKIIEELAKNIGKTPYKISFLNFFIRIFLPLPTPLQSAFGSLYYSPDVTKMPFEQDYQLVGFEDSIKKVLN